MSALDAAVTLAEASGWSLTNLELQKMLYIAQMTYMGENNSQPLFSDDFQAWKLGPVVPAVYNRARDYGSAAVRNLFHKKGPMGPKKIQTIKEVYEDLKGRNAWDLVAITHWSGGAWYKNFNPGQNFVQIPKRDIVEEYRARLNS